MEQHFLKLNEEKTQVMLIGLPSQLAKLQASHICINVGKFSIVPVTSTRSIGAVIDKGMTMEEHISAVVRSANIHIRRIGKISKYLTRNDTETLVHAFVTSRFDHLNGLLYGVPKKLIF